MRVLGGWCVLCLLLIGCAHYRVIELERFHDPNGTDGNVITTYAVTKNNMIIPELVIDRTGRYPTEISIAKERLAERRDVMQKLVNEKYKTENSFLFQSKRIIFMIGQIIVSPIVVPVMFCSDLMNKTLPEHEDTSLLKHYFRQIINAPVPQKPVLRNEMIV